MPLLVYINVGLILLQHIAVPQFHNMIGMRDDTLILLLTG